jgi:rubrerythrin
MIYQKDSTALHLRMGRRHERLCGRVPGAELFATAIRPTLERLKTKETERVAADEAREEAYDEVVLCDILLDNAVRNVFERVRQHDRDHLTQTLDLLFPGREYSSIINTPMSEEPQEVYKLTEKLAGLDEGHPLKELIAPLHERMGASVQAWTAYQQAITRVNGIQAAEEHERLAVRLQYEHNWLDARKQYGASVANRIFPKINSKAHAPSRDGADPTEAGEA